MSGAGSIAVCFFSTLRLSIHAKTVPIFLCKIDYSSKKGGQRLSFKADPEIPFHTLRPTFLSNPIDPYSLFCKGSGKINLCSIRNTSLKQTKIRISCSPFLAGFFPIPSIKRKAFAVFLYKPVSGSFLRCPDTLPIKPSPKAILTPLLCKDSSKIKQPKPNSFPPVKFSRLPPKQTIRIDCPTACSLSIQAAPALKAHLPIHPTTSFLHPSP